MKAIEYAEKYDKQYADIKSLEDERKFISDFIIAFALDVQNICKIRNVKFDSAAKSVITEVNQKCNKAMGILEKRHGFKILKDNALILYIDMRIKEDSQS